MKAITAKASAERAASVISPGSRLAQAMLREAELTVIRRHVIRAMGEDAYWTAVRREIER